VGFTVADVIERMVFKSIFFYLMASLLGIALWTSAVTDALQSQGNKEKTNK